MPDIVDLIKPSVEANWFNVHQIDRDVTMLTPFQRELFVQFYEQKAGVGKLTESQVFTWGKFGPSEKLYPHEKRQVKNLIDRGLLSIQPGVTPGHNRYQLTLVGQVMACFVVPELRSRIDIPDIGEDKVKPIEYSGMTTRQILESIPKMDVKDRVFPPDHILALVDISLLYEIHPGDDELQDAINEAYESQLSIPDSGNAPDVVKKVMIAGKEYDLD